MPFDPESYVHRIGRTGRAGKKGTAITLVTPIEFHSMQRIGKKVGSKMEHRMVPSLRDVKENKLVKIADEIKNAEVNDSASKLLALLEEEMDMSQIALKLLSNLLRENSPVGPDKIGLDKKTFENVVKNIEERENSRGRSGGRRDSRSGGYRSSSREGGGYRGSREGGSRDNGGYKGSRESGSKDARPPRGESRNPFAKEGGGYKGSRDGGESRAPRAPRGDKPSGAPRSDAGRAPKAAPRNAYKKD